jgi:peptide/nickel transport system permease protein
MQHAPWLMLFPGLAIMGGILGFNLTGDALRDILDPRTQRREA